MSPPTAAVRVKAAEPECALSRLRAGSAITGGGPPAAVPHRPGRGAAARVEGLIEYPEWDSNPQQAGFEPTASASWAIGAAREAPEKHMIAVLKPQNEDVP